MAISSAMYSGMPPNFPRTFASAFRGSSPCSMPVNVSINPVPIASSTHGLVSTVHVVTAAREMAPSGLNVSPTSSGPCGVSTC